MAIYLHKFDTVEDFEDVYNDEEGYIEPWVSLTLENEHVDYNKRPVEIPIRFLAGWGFDGLTLEGGQTLSQGTLLLTKNTVGSVITLTAEDMTTLMTAVGNPLNGIVFMGTNSQMEGEYVYTATFNPPEAYAYCQVCEGVWGVKASDAPVTIDLGEDWLAYVQENPDTGWLMELAVELPTA